LDSFIFSLVTRGVNVINKNMVVYGPNGKDAGEFDIITNNAIIQYKDGSTSAFQVIRQVRDRSEPFTDRPIFVFVKDTDKAGLRTVKGATGKVQIFNERDTLINKLNTLN
jgi:hypothetical protein